MPFAAIDAIAELWELGYFIFNHSNDDEINLPFGEVLVHSTFIFLAVINDRLSWILC